MLIEKNKIEPNIRTLKLLSGEEIICEVLNCDDNIITIRRPLMFVISNNDKLSNDVIFCPWLISMDFDLVITLRGQNIIANVTPSKTAMEKYIEAIN